MEGRLKETAVFPVAQNVELLGVQILAEYQCYKYVKLGQKRKGFRVGIVFVLLLLPLKATKSNS